MFSPVRLSVSRVTRKVSSNFHAKDCRLWTTSDVKTPFNFSVDPARNCRLAAIFISIIIYYVKKHPKKVAF